MLKYDKVVNIGVSPHGIADVKIPGEKHSELPVQTAIVEIKTRVSENTIMKAEKAVYAVKPHSIHGDGKLVACEYNDDIFKKCVPWANRKQVIHQALVTGFSWGVFITAKVEESQGSIVQTVFVHISDEQKIQYLKTLRRVTDKLSLWLFNQDLIERGFLLDSDFPEWVAERQQQIIALRFKLWSDV